MREVLILVMYFRRKDIRGFDLASDTQTGCYIRGFDLQHTSSGGFMHEVLISLLAGRRELIHEVCISLRRAESPKRDQNLVNWVTLERPETDTKCDPLS